MSGEPEVDPYLWDGSGAPTRDVARLEHLLGRFAHDAAPSTVRERPRRWRAPLVVLAAAALLLVWWWPLGGPRDEAADGALDGYRVEWAKGTTVARVGERIEVDDGAAVMRIGDIGQVELRTGAIVRVEQVGDAKGGHERHALYLERGSLHATIEADPRVFQVGSPAGLTIDLGCEYELSVAENGAVTLAVRTGQVSLEYDGREVYVPAGASTVSYPNLGPEPPLFDDADPELRSAIAALGGKGYGKQGLDRLLSLTSRDEALPLFALLFDPSTDPSLREAIYDRFEAVFKRPESVTRSRVLALDPQAREDWLEDDLRSWWRRQR